MEPERKIEKLLRAFAKKRREQAGDAFEMPASTRERLRRELSRRSPGETEGGFFSNFFGFRPRLVFAACFIAIVAVGTLWLLPPLTHPKPTSLASATLDQAKLRPAKQPAPQVAPPPALAPEGDENFLRPTAPPVSVNSRSPEIAATAPPAREEEGRRDEALKVQGDNEHVVNEKRKILAEAALKQAQPSGAAGNQSAIVSADNIPAPSGALENGVMQTNLFAGINGASAPPASGVLADKTETPADLFANAGALNKDRADLRLPPAAQLDTNVTLGAITVAAAEPEAQKKLGVVFYGVAKNEAAGALASQKFYQVDASASRRSAKTPASPVLTSFRVEQNGPELRIVDADGSIYTGTVQTTTAEITSRTVFASHNAPTAAAATARPQAAMPVQNYFFRVAGTNRNLRQNVVFSGNLIPITNALSWTNAGTVGGAAGGGAVQVQPVTWMLSNSRISGTAVIGNQKGIEVNATPAPQAGKQN